MAREENNLLESVSSPDDLKKLSLEELKTYCDELRRYIIEECSVNPGHLASSLGAVELSAALHYVYATPEDKIVWDVGHQTYAHKIITGRREAFHTKRRLGGISGFPRMAESPYDAFGGGHASVSISAAFGMTKAAELQGARYKVVAVIGDGSMTGGLAFEGLNNAGASKTTDLLVILNDNHMAIDQATGALKNYLLRISTSERYNRLKQRLWRLMSHTPWLLRLCQKAGNAVKQGLLNNSNLFESLNFRYFGPVDGHDLKALVCTLRALRDIPGPKLLHVMTVKGKGYLPAEHDQSVWHAPGRFNPDTGERICAPGSVARYQDVFGETLLELARLDRRVVGVTPAMPTGCSMNILMHEMPDRCFDVGIAEGHAVTFSAGLAAAGMVPFCNIYSTFMQRAYDNVIHDVAIQDLPVVMCLDRGGLVGEDGVTHHGVFDMAAFGAVPGLVIAAPMDERELRDMMYTALHYGHPFMIRYPRGCGEGVAWRGEAFREIPVGRGRRLREGAAESAVALLTVGTTGNPGARAVARLAAEGVEVAHYDLRYVKPLDEELLEEVGRRFRKVVTVEDGCLRGGVGEAVAAFFNDRGYGVEVERLGIADHWVEHGTPAQLQALCGFDEEGIFRALRAATHEASVRNQSFPA
ncbi:MAG TPA: 1-deoxy-D-xylulose-5-phosphate synthase [Candidatus Alistipes intestinipullorum]|nr:1-deoxy-D-xylulose-5-phosphate synthase [Candidatus Alistipes intestinipullorum]